jgi:putative ABC transport system permease protein
MLLARATVRSREIAVRTALGAQRGRLVRQLLTESFTIAIAAAGIGLLMSRGLMQLLVWITQGQQLFFVLAELDRTVLAFTLLISLITPLAFGLLPAIRASRADAGRALKEGSARSGSGRESSRLRGILVGAQMSLALMLMIVAGLIVRSVINQQQRELGFNPANLLTVELTLPEAKYSGDQAITQFYRELMEGASGLPDVAGVALVSHLPAIFVGQNRSFEIESQPVVDELQRPAAHVNVASANYTELMGIPLVRGRSFAAADAEQSFPVALISLEAAERYWPEKEPIGERIRIRENDPWVQIVGIVGNVRPDDNNDERPSPQIYLPFQQNARPDMYVLVRSGGGPLALAASVRQEVWAVDPNQPIDETSSMEQALFDSDSTTYALITLFIAFAFFALCMAAAGIYGVMSYAVSRRAGEIGIRMALGATASDVRRMVLASGGKLIAIGGVIGMGGAALISRLMSSLVFGISTLDPLTFVGVTIVLAAVGLFANYVPARRATRTDPMVALRAE